ncbi:hypothetical protein [Paenibacillus sp. NPDC055715]
MILLTNTFSSLLDVVVDELFIYNRALTAQEIRSLSLVSAVVDQEMISSS